MSIKIGDLVKFKHHIFDEFRPVQLVVEVLWGNGGRCIRLHGRDDIIPVINFVVVKKV